MSVTRRGSGTRLSAAALLLRLGLIPLGADAGELRSDFEALLRGYARGERAAAVAALGSWSTADLERQLAVVRSWVLAAERCPDCAAAVELKKLPLRAALMLHWDRNDAERPPPTGVEHPRPCVAPVGLVAGQYAGLLARLPDTRDFARRFFLLMVLRSQWDFCLEDARRRADDGLARFPRDPDLLVAAGCVHEEAATLGGSLKRPPPRRTDSGARLPTLVTEQDPARLAAEGFQEARRLFETAVVADAGNVAARLHLGRVLWRLGESEQALLELQAALERSRAPGERYLAHLFLGRLHEDAQRLAAAIQDYRKAMEIDPQAQTPAVALSHALRLAGDGGGAREALVRRLAQPPRGQGRDAYWDYLVTTGVDLRQLEADLRRESLQ